MHPPNTTGHGTEGSHWVQEWLRADLAGRPAGEHISSQGPGTPLTLLS